MTRRTREVEQGLHPIQENDRRYRGIDFFDPEEEDSSCFLLYRLTIMHEQAGSTRQDKLFGCLTGLGISLSQSPKIRSPRSRLRNGAPVFSGS